MQPHVVRYVDCDVQVRQITKTAILQRRMIANLDRKAPVVIQMDFGDCVPLGRQERLDPFGLGCAARDLERVDAVCESSSFDVHLSADLMKVECLTYLIILLSQDRMCPHSHSIAPHFGRAGGAAIN
jgi:hypothetical protein